jgi:hypothetical protein
MKRNLLSNLGKLALIPTLAFSLNTNKIQAQTSLELQGEYALRFGWSSYTNKMSPYENWRDHFIVKKGDPALNLTNETLFKRVDLDVALYPTLDLGGYIKIGGAVEGSLGNLLTKRSLNKISLENWDTHNDPIEMQSIYTRQITPSLGGFIEFPVNGWDYLRFKATVQKYKAVEEKRQDKKYQPALKCTGPHHSIEDTEIFEEKRLPNKLTKKFSIDWKMTDRDPRGLIGVYYETDFNGFNEFGARAGCYFSTD